MNYNPTPKSEYVSSPTNIKEHHAIVESMPFRYAVQVALAQYARELTASRPADMGSCAAAALKLQGAHEFLNTLLNLSETSLPANIAPLDNLTQNKHS